MPWELLESSFNDNKELLKFELVKEEADTNLEDIEEMSVTQRRKLDTMVVINNGLQLCVWSRNILEWCSAVDKGIQDAPQRPDIRLAAYLR